MTVRVVRGSCRGNLRQRMPAPAPPFSGSRTDSAARSHPPHAQVANYASIAANCNWQRSSCGTTCSDVCLECPAGAANNSY